jgi:hypothetical protein
MPKTKARGKAPITRVQEHDKKRPSKGTVRKCIIRAQQGEPKQKHDKECPKQEHIKELQNKNMARSAHNKSMTKSA